MYRTVAAKQTAISIYNVISVDDFRGGGGSREWSLPLSSDNFVEKGKTTHF